MGGLWKQVPVMGAMGLIFAMASLGLPGLGNFIAEFLILAGTYKASILMASLACTGLVAATIYSLRIVQKVFLGKENTQWKIQDLSAREKIISAALVIMIIYLGLMPQKVLDTSKPSVLKTLGPIEQKLVIHGTGPTDVEHLWLKGTNPDIARATYLK
jgi:NADH-quinone oxidoreductase subunit M